MLGRPGVGKSAFVKFLSYKWSRQELDIPFDWVFHLPFKEIVPYVTTNLCEIIYRYWAQHFYISEKTWEDAWKNIITQKVLIIFDGYDEASSQSTRKHINRLLQEVNHFGNYVLSTRPYHLHDLPQIDLKFELVGFNHANIRKFVENNLSENETFLLDTIENNSNIQSIMQTPLNAALICMIWQRWPQKNFNMTILYNLMINYLLCRHANSAEQHIIDPVEIRKQMRSQFEHLYAIALSSMETGALVFELDMNKFSSADVREMLNMGLIKSTKESEEITELSQKRYHFFHLTFQEYMVAEYYATLLKGKNADQVKQARNFIMTHKFDSRYFLVLTFIAGLVKDDAFAINVYFDILLEEPRDFLVIHEITILIRCLEECQMSPLLVIKDRLIDYIKNIFKSSEQYNEFFEIFQGSPEIVNNTQNAASLIFDLKAAPNAKEREEIYEMMVVIAEVSDVDNFSKLLIAIIEISMDEQISLKSYQACKVLFEMMEVIDARSENQDLHKSILNKIGKDNVVKYFIHFKSILNDKSKAKHLRRGAIIAIHAFLNFIKIVSWESYVYIYNLVQDKKEDQEILERAESILEYAFHYYEVELLKENVSAIIKSLDQSITNGEEGKKRIYGYILGNIVMILKLDPFIHINLMVKYIWNTEMPKDIRLEIAHALMAFLEHFDKSILKDMSQTILSVLNSETLESTLKEIGFEFFLNKKIADKQNFDEELNLFLKLLRSPDDHDIALECLRIMMHLLNKEQVNKILMHINILPLENNSTLLYFDILNDINLSNIYQDDINQVAMMFIYIIEQNCTLSNNEDFLSYFKTICFKLNQIYKTLPSNINQKIIKSLERMINTDNKTCFYEEAFYITLKIRRHLNLIDTRMHISSLAAYIYDNYSNNLTWSLYSEFYNFSPHELLLFYQKNSNHVFYKELFVRVLVHQFYQDENVLYLEDVNTLHYFENGDLKSFQLAFDEAQALAKAIKTYVESLGYAPFENHRPGSQSRFLLHIGAPLLLIFGAKTVTNLSINPLLKFANHSCNLQ